MSFRKFLKGGFGSGRRMSDVPNCEDSDNENEGGSKKIEVHPDTANPDKVWDRLKVKQTFKTVTPMDPSTPKPEGYTRFVCISDTHSRQSHMPPIPQGDVLLHAGDFTNIGMPKEVVAFNDFLGSLPHKHKIVIAGNHEVTFDKKMMDEGTSQVFMGFSTALQQLKKDDYEDISSLLTNCTYLQDTETTVCGFRIYGSPWQPEFYDWGFNLPRGQACLDKWEKIPEGIDILMTHGPPLGHGDVTSGNNRTGCVELLNTVQKRIKPKYHVFGHIHESYGMTTDGVTTYINACTCTLRYAPVNAPIVFDLPTPESDVVTEETQT
ncbi:metallophosphoesterase MPPED2-like [Antedon mediterranea]|uniref:metallophosphoesterase MPPED2-like n=1 Tax=Antedon mediterranea TaxID=105859 RepID=UPI003AF8255B